MAHYRLPAGALVSTSSVPTTPPAVLAPLQKIDSAATTNTFVAVHSDGSIDHKLWIGASPRPNQILSKHVTRSWFGKATFSPADCHYSPVAEPSTPSRERESTELEYTVVYLGRDSSGLLKFAAIHPGYASSFTSRVLLVPAEPGIYNVHGLELRVIGVNGFKLTYEIQSAGTPDEGL